MRPSPTRAWAARWCMSSTARPTPWRQYRDWQAAGRHFLVRAKDGRKVRWQGQEQSLAEVAGRLPLRRCREVPTGVRRAVQHVAEAEVVLDRPAGGIGAAAVRLINQRVPGPPLTLRLVVSRVCDASGRTLAVWYLLTNLPATVATDTAALWYYWRWRIESLFKLFKSAGHQVEHWQQQGGGHRQATADSGHGLRAGVAVGAPPFGSSRYAAQLLVQLSGRQLNYRRRHTTPALLAGLWVLLAMLEVMQQHRVEDLRGFKKLLLDVVEEDSG